MPMPELIALIQDARLVVTNGGDTLLQVLALRRPCVSVSLSPDQTRRLARLAASGVDVEVPLSADTLVDRVRGLQDTPGMLELHLRENPAIDLRDGADRKFKPPIQTKPRRPHGLMVSRSRSRTALAR